MRLCTDGALRIHTVERQVARALIIGDIHGCLTQLKQLLQKAQMHLPTQAAGSASSSSSSSSSTDLCVFVGDLVNKGPDSFGVVRFLRDIGAVGVLGNHDAKLVELVDKLHGGEALSAKDAKSSLYALAQSCPQDVYDYLRQLPHILRLPQFRAIVVHAGLDPTLPLAAQSVLATNCMRNLLSSKKYYKKREEEAQHKIAATATNESSEASGESESLASADKHAALHVSAHFAAMEKHDWGKPWAAMYNSLVSSHTSNNSSGNDGGGGAGEVDVVDEDGDVTKKWRKVKEAVREEYKNTTVVFGHDARRKLQQYDYAIGLDTACVMGGSLTGLWLPSRELVAVPGWRDSVL